MKRIVLPLLLVLVPLAAQAASDTKVDIKYDGLDRSYLVHLPSPSPKDPPPLVVVLHGGAGNAENAAKMTGFDAEADLHGFIVVYPNGTGTSHPLLRMVGKGEILTWNAGDCCGYAQEHDIDDVGFIRAVVMAVLKDNEADPKRVYATGISNGGMMSYRLACEASDLFAAIAPVSAVQEVQDCKPAQPVSVFHIHGAKDQNVLLNGGIGPKEVGKKQDRPPVQQSIDFWVKQDGCSATVHSKEPDVDMSNYGGCDAGSEVQYFLILDGGHSWPGGQQIAFFLDKPSQALDATHEIWKFFSAHAKP